MRVKYELKDNKGNQYPCNIYLRSYSQNRIPSKRIHWSLYFKRITPYARKRYSFRNSIIFKITILKNRSHRAVFKTLIPQSQTLLNFLVDLHPFQGNYLYDKPKVGTE